MCSPADCTASTAMPSLTSSFRSFRDNLLGVLSSFLASSLPASAGAAESETLSEVLAAAAASAAAAVDGSEGLASSDFVSAASVCSSDFVSPDEVETALGGSAADVSAGVANVSENIDSMSFRLTFNSGSGLLEGAASGAGGAASAASSSAGAGGGASISSSAI